VTATIDLTMDEGFGRWVEQSTVVISLESGKVEGKLRFTAACEEIFGVDVLPGKRRVQLLHPADGVTGGALDVAGGGVWLGRR
jgi:hypothetical protein